MSRLDEQELNYLITSDETNSVEFKVAPPRPAELAERICGLANARGGYIILGIEDETLRVVGVNDIKAAIDILHRAVRLVEPELAFDPVEPELYLKDSKSLVVATIPSSSGPIYQASGRFWIRRGTHTVPMSASDMLELAHDRGLLKWELAPVPEATLADLDREKLEEYLNIRPIKERYARRLDNLEETLIGMRCATRTLDGIVRPTNAGLLFFGQDPQYYLFQTEIVAVAFRDTLGLGGYVERKILRGSLRELIDQTEAFLNFYTPVSGRIEGWKRIDTPALSIEALREAVVNAVVHRDYSREGESIRVFIYSDRVEIHIPGLLLPGITVEQMARGEVNSKLRNPILANLLRDLPGGYIERIGSGIRMMLAESKKLGLPRPQFKQINEFVVTFYKAETPPPDPMNEEVTAQSGGKIGETAATPERFSLKKRHELAMQYIQQHGSITNSEYRELTGMSERAALRDLEKLLEMGVLKVTGKTRDRKYLLP